MTSTPPALPYEPYEALEDRRHVMVDGAARPSSVLTLSHWPQSPTPTALAHDLSAEIVLGYLGWRDRRRAGTGREIAKAVAAAASAEAVTNDHFDEDGLMSVFVLVAPATALAAADLVCDVASCGDFGVVATDRAAEIAFAIGPLAEAEAGSGAGTSELYGAILPLVPELLAHPERFSHHWSPEMERLVASRAAISAGEVELAEDRRADLCVVSRSRHNGESRLPGAEGGLPVHAVAVHSSTTASRIVAFDGDRCDVFLRYEGWVRYISRRVPLRPDLEPLAGQLTALEPGGVTWDATGVGAIIGHVHPGGEGRTEIAPENLESIVREYLVSAPPAWDPFRAGGGYIPVDERAGYRGRRPRRALVNR